VNPRHGAVVPQPGEYVENAPKDMVTALPDQITRIKATFGPEPERARVRSRSTTVS
jgi:hypothetical protein